MRWLFSFLLLALLGVAQAISYTGGRLLVIVDDVAEREKYSVFLGDLEGELYSARLESSEAVGSSMP